MSTSDVSPELRAPFSHLTSLHRDLVSLHSTLTAPVPTGSSTSSTTSSTASSSSSSTSSSGPSSGDTDFLKRLSRIQGLLVEMENRFKKGGVWMGELEKGQIPRGQAMMQDLLEDCHGLVSEIQEDLEKTAGKERSRAHTHEHSKEKMKEENVNRRKKRAAKRATALDEETLSELAEEMVGPYKEMLSVFYELIDLCSSGSGNEDQLRQLRRLQGLLDSYEGKYKHVGNIWCGDLSKRNIPSGQALMNELCDESHDLIEELYDELEIRSEVSEQEPEKRSLKRQEKKHLRQQKKRTASSAAGAGGGGGAGVGAGAGAGAGAGTAGVGAGAGGQVGWDKGTMERGEAGSKEKGTMENIREARA